MRWPASWGYHPLPECWCNSAHWWMTDWTSETVPDGQGPGATGARSTCMLRWAVPALASATVCPWPGSPGEDATSSPGWVGFIKACYLFGPGFKQFPVVVPTPLVLSTYHKIAGPMLSSPGEHIQESRTLAALRDAMLPKLISGELRLPDTERIVGRAT